jgi:tetratricopeptide (TPR) repeat protein
MRVRRSHILIVLAALPILGLGARLCVVGIARAHVPSPQEFHTLARQKKFDEAEVLLARYLEAYPDDAESQLLMAQVATDRADPKPEVALAHLAHVPPGSRRRDALVQFFRGKAYYLQKQYDRAETCWREAIRIDPLVPEAGWALVDLLDLAGRTEEAHRVGMRQCEVEPDPVDRVRLLVGVARLDIESVEAGAIVANFEPLYREHPDNMTIAIAVGRALVKDSRAAAGLPILEAVLKRNPQRPEAWDAWLTGLDDAGETERLVAEFGRLPRSIAGDARFAKHEGRVALIKHQNQQAADAFRKAHAVEPYDGVVLYRFHSALRLADQTDEARRVKRDLDAFQGAFKELRTVTQDAKDRPALGRVPDPTLYHRMASLRERMGRPDEARAWHRLVLQDRPNDPMSLAALERLR